MSTGLVIDGSGCIVTSGVGCIVTGDCDGTLYRQARSCLTDLVADVWMTNSDALSLPNAFYIAGVDCLHFDFGDPTYSTPGGTVYTPFDVVTYDSCDLCYDAYCITTYDWFSLSPSTVSAQVPTSVSFGSCPTPAACAPSVSGPITLDQDGSNWRYFGGAYPPYPSPCIGGYVAGDPSLNTTAMQVNATDGWPVFNDPGDNCAYQYLEFLYQTGSTSLDVLIVLYRRKVITNPQPINGGPDYEYFRTVAYPWDNSNICTGAVVSPLHLRVT